jgi:putative protease
LLAPAGDWDCARAAVENGADAIYFGLERFNARMRAANFTAATLPELMRFLHRRGVRGYVTFNTLVFTPELDDVARLVRAAIAAGVDAAIVQDIGLCRVIRAISPDFPIHASTQMSVTSAAGVEFARDLGCRRVVLARECSIRDLARIRAALSSAEATEIVPIEVFVHGALCVAYSGQCLTSEALGGRSANRGECAQACRMPYELVSDGRVVDTNGRRYLLSPQDLAGVDMLAELVRAGVTSFKIEGRLKSPEYVASVTRVYRQALDAVLQREPRMLPATAAAVAPGASKEPAPAGGDTRYELEMAFSRGLSTGWLRGTNNQELVHGRFAKKRGAFIGRVAGVETNSVLVELECAAAVKPGDGLVFDDGRAADGEPGGRVYDVVALTGPGRSHRVRLRFGSGQVDWARVNVGDRVWKTSDPALERRIRQTYAGTRPRFRRPIQMTVAGRAGELLCVTVRDEAGRELVACSALPLAAALEQPLDDARLRAHLGRLGDTPFRLEGIEVRLTGRVILPVSELNRLRRQLAEQLETRWSSGPCWEMRPESVIETLPGFGGARAPARSADAAANPVELVVLARTQAQLEAALRAGVRTVYCDFEDPKRYRGAVEQARDLWGRATPPGSADDSRKEDVAAPVPRIYVAPPRIFKPGEDWILRQVASCGADGFLVRNYDHLRWFAGARCVADFSFNAANPVTVAHLLERYPLERVTASYDLNVVQLEALLRRAPPERLEITIHQHMPMFHMEHCVFCAFLSSGTDYTNCGRPCDRHAVRLRDRAGAEHPLRADAGCRNTVFNARAQTGAEYVGALLGLGARWLRIEFVDEDASEVVTTLDVYRRLLRGEVAGIDVWRQLKAWHRLGVTRGPMENPERL